MYKHRKNFAFAPAVFGGMMDNMMSNKWDRMFFDDNWSNTTAPVNIKETDASFVLDIIAPGLSKEDFNINVDKDVLSVSFEKQDEKTETSDKVIRNEYQFRSFKRSFTLGEKVDVAGINAAYNNGVLTVILPKTTVQEASARKIEIA